MTSPYNMAPTHLSENLMIVLKMTLLFLSVRPPFEQMGSNALLKLLDVVDEKNIMTGNSLLPCTLIRRESIKSVI